MQIVVRSPVNILVKMYCESSVPVVPHKAVAQVSQIGHYGKASQASKHAGKPASQPASQASHPTSKQACKQASRLASKPATQVSKNKQPPCMQASKPGRQPASPMP